MEGSDDFDTPSVMLIPVDKPAAKLTAAERAARVRQGMTAGLNAAGRPFIRPAQAWKAEDDRRKAARSEEALRALREANTAHRDAMRDLRRDRKAFEKARSEVHPLNVFNGERRAARIVVRDSRQLAREASSAKREARRNYPITLPSLALRCHLAHLVPTFAWELASNSVAAHVAYTGSLSLLAFNAATVFLGGRHVPRGDGADAALEALRPSQEERDLLQRLEPKAFARFAEPRGLSDVVASGATLTESGIQAKLTLNGTMDLDRLKKAEAHLRAALRLREGTRMELREGKTGGHARLTLRTRSMADGVSLVGWTPGVPWGVNTVTGKSVPVPLGRRMLVAGTSGSGKSWSARPILAEASDRDDHRLVVLDMKRIEARLWKRRARIAVTPDQIAEVLAELVAEMFDRLDMIPDGRDTVAISSTLPRLTVFVDEGSELIAVAKGDRKAYGSILSDLRTLARMGRAAEIVLVWATQKPMLTGDSPGLDTQIAAQITCRMSLAVSTGTEASVIFGDDAIAKGWLAHELPMPGVAMLRDSNRARPEHIRMRAMSPADVMALPDRPVWSRRASSTGATVMDLAARRAAEQPQQRDTDTLSLTKGATVVRMTAADRDDQIIEALRADPCRTLSELARSVGAHKQVVKRSLERMQVDGLVRQDDDGCWHPVG